MLVLACSHQRWPLKLKGARQEDICTAVEKTRRQLCHGLNLTFCVE